MGGHAHALTSLFKLLNNARVLSDMHNEVKRAWLGVKWLLILEPLLMRRSRVIGWLTG
jgi:hypothetical protein